MRADAFELGPALLFCPADRPDRYAKAADRADAVILDLEDAVAAENREAARAAVADSALLAQRTLVRVNPAGGTEIAADLDAVAVSRYRILMLAKTASPADVDEVARRLPEARVVALCETAAGVMAAADIARHPRVVAVMWGAEDLVASLGGTSSRHADGSYRDVARHARSSVLLAAGAAGIAAVDTVHLAIDDLDGLRREAQDAAAVGFAATACIHPAQVPVIRDAYRPAADEIERARAVLAAAETAHGVFRFDGHMVDEPVLQHARAVLRHAG